MKKLAYAATMLLSAMALTTMTACGGNEKEATEVKGEQKGEAHEALTNIRYVDMDTLLAKYDYAVEQNKVVEQIDLDLQAYQAQLGRTLQNKQAAMQQKMNANAYTEASYKADMEELQRLDQSSSQLYQQRAMTDAMRVDEIKKALMDTIDAYIVKYNKEKKYDAILLKNAGIYFNPALDITGELVKGLNAEHQAKKAPADAKAADAPKADTAKK